MKLSFHTWNGNLFMWTIHFTCEMNWFKLSHAKFWCSKQEFHIWNWNNSHLWSIIFICEVACEIACEIFIRGCRFDVKVATVLLTTFLLTNFSSSSLWAYPLTSFSEGYKDAISSTSATRWYRLNQHPHPPPPSITAIIFLTVVKAIFNWFKHIW